MALTATIAGVSVGISAISRPDTLDQRTICTVTIVDSAGTAFYQKGQPIVITDSILGTVFTGMINQPQMTLLYPSVQKMWTLDCVQKGDYLAGKRTSNRSYGNQYTGTVVVDEVQRYGSAEGLKANAALRWDELQTDWASGTLSNTVASTNASNGNVGGGDLELSLAGVSIVHSKNAGSGFVVQNGLKLTGYASSGYSTAYVYRQIWTGSIVIATNDNVQFDVWIDSASPSITASVNLTCSDGTTLNASTNTDNQGMSMAIKTDLSGLANDQWYSRLTIFGGSFIGKTITSAEVALGGVNAGTYTAYFRRIQYQRFSGGSFITFFGDTSTLTTNNLIANNGYSNVSLSEVVVKDKTAFRVIGPISLSAVAIVKDSQMSYVSLIPSGAVALIETSIDNQASWQAHTSGNAIPNLLPGMSVSGRSLYYRHTLTQGTNPTLAMGIGTVFLTVHSAYNATKSDVIQAYTTATDFNTGTLTNLKTVGSTTTQGVTTNGFQATWDGTAPTAASFGTGNSALINKQIIANVSNTFDFRLRMDFAGQWSNFITEVDVTVPASTSASAGLVYRCTGWQAANNTYAYAASVSTNAILLGRGTNTATGAGGFASISSTALSLTANSVHRLKIVAIGSLHQLYLDGVLLVSAQDATYSQYSLAIRADTPLGYYRMDEASGTTLIDSGPNASNGTINASGVTYAQTGAVSTDTDTAQKYDGTAGHSNMNASVTAAGLSHVTIECWANLTSNTYTGNPRLIANGHTDTLFTGMQLWISASGSHVMMDVGNGTTHGLATSTSSLVAGTWTHVVGTYDGANVKIYFNGVLQATTAFTGTIASTTFACGIGYNPVYSGDFFPGTIDECAVYTSTLSQAQITAHYTAATTLLSTSTSAGYIGLRTFNNSGTATISTPYDNFGVCSALSGTWQSPSISLAGVTTYGNSVFSWDTDGLPDTTCSISAQTSIDGGATFQSATNGGAISGLVAGQSLTGKSVIILMTLTASNAPIVPTMNGVSVWVMGQYVSIGTRISPTLSLAGVGRAATALINWNANTPANTSVTAQTSLNSGSTWQTLTSPGDPVTYINTQSDPSEDTFTANSSADYVSTHMAGGANATWTWDTTHSRLTGTGGNNDVLWYLTDVVADVTVQAVMDISQNAGLVVRMLDANNLYIAYVEDSSFGNTCTIWKVFAGTFTQIGTATLSFPTGTPHLFQLSAIGTTIALSMDNVTLISITDTSLQGAGKVGMHAGTSGRFYSFRMQSIGESVTSLSLLTKLILTSTDPTSTPQVLDMQAFVSSPDIGQGVLIPSVAYLRTFLSDNIADLNTKSDYWTTWRNDNTLLFQPPEATPAPYVLSSLNSQVIAGQVINDILVDSAELDNSGDAYRNRQIVQNAIATSEFTEIKFGDGSTTSWSVANPLTAPPDSIVLNGQSQSFGIKGIDTGKAFYYQIGSTSIDQDSSQTVLQNSDSFSIIYIGSFSQDLVLDNIGQFSGTISQSMMAAIDGSSGIVESVLDLSSTPTTVEAATVQGNQLLQRFGNIGRTFKCKTLRSGFAPGQQVSVFSSEFNLSNVQMLVTEVDVTIAQAPGVNGGLLYAWQLTMMEGPNLGTWVQLFTNAFSPAASSGGAGGTNVTTLFRQKNVIYVEDYGAIGDGVSDDTAALQAALSAATTGTAVQLAPTTYLISGSLLYPGGIKIQGAGDSDSGTVIKVKSGTALTTPILCSADWYNNSTTSGLPVLISDIKIDGNSATSGAAAHGFVAMNYWSSFDRMTITNVAGDGFLFTAQSKNGTHISNTCNEPKINRLQVRTTGGEGIHIQDNGTGVNSTTDGFLENCIVQNAGANAINCEMAPGWLIRGNHIYGTVTGGIIANKCFATRVHGNYVDGFGSGTSTFVAGISMTVLNGRGSSCIGNVVGFESSTATGPYTGIGITGAGSAASVVEIGYNVVNGNNQSASNGYVIQAASSQQPFSWIAYFHDNDAMNVNHYSFFDSFTTGGDLQVLQHIASVQGNAPTAAAGSNAGTSPPAPVLTNCSDLDGQITFGTGTSPALGNMVVLTFNKPYATAPRVIFTPINDATAALRWSVTSTTTNFTYKVGVAPAASQANTIYGFHYHVMA